MQHLEKMEKRNQKILATTTALKSVCEKRTDSFYVKRNCSRREYSKPSKHDPKNITSVKHSIKPYEGKNLSGNDKLKQNWNHLLNFKYEERGGNKNKELLSIPIRKQKYSKQPFISMTKERYLLCNCQFVLKQDFNSKSYDFSRHVFDADQLICWNDVIQVRLFCEENDPIVCPICLYEPRASKITKCGHCFCHPCIIKYNALSEKNKECPLCQCDLDIENELRFLAIKKVNRVKIGSTISFDLMHRSKYNVLALPATQKLQLDCENLQTFSNDCAKIFAKALISTNIDAKDIYENHIDQLLILKDEDPNNINECHQYIDIALNSVYCILEKNNVSKENKYSVDIPTYKIHSENNFVNKESCMQYIDAFDNIIESIEIQKLKKNVQDDKNNIAFFDNIDLQNSDGFFNNNNNTETDKSYPDKFSSVNEDPDRNVFEKNKDANNNMVVYFYQASTGQHIFLHPLNARMLIQHFGGKSLADSPIKIEGSVLELEHCIITEDSRKRNLRFFSHLPLGCELILAEIDLSSIVSQDICEQFEKNLSCRLKEREKKERLETRRSNRIERETKKLLGFTYRKPSVKSEMPSLLQNNKDLNKSIDIDDKNEEPITDNYETSKGGKSFAEMLRLGKVKPSILQQKQHGNSNVVETKSTINHSSEDDDHAPSFSNSFKDAVEEAIDKNIKKLSETSVNTSKGKKKKVKKLLFSTSMNI